MTLAISAIQALFFIGGVSVVMMWIPLKVVDGAGKKFWYRRV